MLLDQVRAGHATGEPPCVQAALAVVKSSVVEVTVNSVLSSEMAQVVPPPGCMFIWTI